MRRIQLWNASGSRLLRQGERGAGGHQGWAWVCFLFQAKLSDADGAAVISLHGLKNKLSLPTETPQTEHSSGPRGLGSPPTPHVVACREAALPGSAPLLTGETGKTSSVRHGVCLHKPVGTQQRRWFHMVTWSALALPWLDTDSWSCPFYFFIFWRGALFMQSNNTAC